MKYQIKWLDPMSVGKIFGLSYAALSFLFIPIFVPFMLAGFAASTKQQTPFPPGLGVGLGFLLIILIPVLYGVMGFIMGALMALIYNLVSRWVGGIVMEFAAPGTASTSTPEPPYPLVPHEGIGGSNV